MWNNSPGGRNTHWYNNGIGGMTTDDIGGGMGGNVDFATGAFTAFESLGGITISRANYYSVGNGAGLADRVQNQAYSESPFYQHVRDEWAGKRWDEFQSDLDWAGAIPLLGEPVDLLNGGISAIRGNYGAASLSLAATVPVLGWGAFAIKKADKFHTVYRAVSKAELDDIAVNGLRTISGGYETGKLFAPTINEAAMFGKNNFVYDGLPNFLIEVQVPGSIMSNAYKFSADGMNALSIPANQLHLLNATPINFSPIVK